MVEDLSSALKVARELLVEGKLGDAGHTVIVEDFLKGYELTAMAITDGNSYKMLPLSQDHKRVFDNDEGPNTGGMGAYAPLPQVSDDLKGRIESEIIRPTVEAVSYTHLDVYKRQPQRSRLLLSAHWPSSPPPFSFLHSAWTA